MKTKFEINVWDNGVKDGFEYYEKYFKKEEFVLDKESQEVYKIYEKEINLNEGDRVDLLGFRIVRWKCVDIDNDMIIYSLNTE